MLWAASRDAGCRYARLEERGNAGHEDRSPSPEHAQLGNSATGPDQNKRDDEPSIFKGLLDPKSSNYFLNVDGNGFNTVIGIIITLNAVVLGLEADWGAENFGVCENCFAIAFLAEMFLRMHHCTVCGYFKRFANCFDCFLVLTTAIDLWLLPYIAGNLNLGWVTRLVRSVRLFRILRIIRLFRMFRPLGIMLDAFMAALGRVSWTGLLTLVLMYMCSILLTQTVGKFADDWEADAENIETWFGSIGNSMRTLFIIITLSSWDTIAMTVAKQVHPLLVFIGAGMYIILTSFTMVSLITGIISEALIVAQLRDEQHRLQEIADEKERIRTSLRAWLEEVDRDKSGTLSVSEIQRLLSRENYLTARLQLLDISMSDLEARTLLDSLADSDGEVGIGDLVDALSHMTGAAKASSLWDLKRDIYKMRHEAEDDREQVRRIANQTVSIEARLGRLEEKLDHLCTTLSSKGADS